MRMADAALAVGVEVTASGEVSYPPNPSWQRQWQDLVAARATVTAYRAGSGPDNQDARRAIEAGCAASSSLAENLPQRHAAVKHRLGNPALKDAYDIFNTTKHGTRRRGETSGHVATADLCKFTDPGSSQVRTRDALELLTTCCDAWAKYLGSIGLTVVWPQQ